MAGLLLLLAAGCSTTPDNLVAPLDTPWLPAEAAQRALRAGGNRIESLDWRIDREDRIHAEVSLACVDSGAYRVSFRSGPGLDPLSYTSSVMRLAAGSRETRRMGPFSRPATRPEFGRIFVVLERDDRGAWQVQHTLDTFYLCDTRRVNDAALRAAGIRHVTAREILAQYAPMLKTDVTLNGRTGQVFIEQGPKRIPDIMAAVGADANCTGLRYHDGAAYVMITNPVPRDLLARNADKDLGFIDLAEPFSGRSGDWREFLGGLSNAVYGRLVLDTVRFRGFTCTNAVILQYWIPFYVNHLALLKIDRVGQALLWDMGNYHEGEAENISILLVPTNGVLEPRYAGYAKHYKGSVSPWSCVRKYAAGGRITRHPVVYVASGSHASFFSPFAAETPFGLGMDRTYHMGGGYWFGPACGDQPYQLEVLPALDEVDADSVHAWLRFRGRFGKTYIASRGSWINCSPFLFPYVRYPEISLRTPWIAGSGVNRWIQPGAELEYCARYGLKLGCNPGDRPLRVITNAMTVRVAEGAVRIAGLDVDYGHAFPMPLVGIAFFHQAADGEWMLCGQYDPRRAAPPELAVPLTAAAGPDLRLLVCDVIDTAGQAKPPLPADAHAGSFEYLRAVELVVPVPPADHRAPAGKPAQPPAAGLVIQGPMIVPGGSQAAYRGLVLKAGEEPDDVTARARWRLDAGAPAMLHSNQLVAGFVLSNTALRVHAEYAGHSAQLDIRLTGADADEDGLSDQHEVGVGTSPNNDDTDSDGLGDATDPDPWRAAPAGPGGTP